MFLKFPRQTFTKPRMVCLAEAILEVHCIRSMLLPPSPSRASPLCPCMGLRAHILGHRPGAPGSPSHFLSLFSQTCSPLLSPRAGTVCFHLFERIHFWIPQWPTGSLCWVHASTSCSAGIEACVIVHEMGLPAYSQVLGFIGKPLILSCHFISIVLLLAKPGCLQRHLQMHGDVN